MQPRCSRDTPKTLTFGKKKTRPQTFFKTLIIPIDFFFLFWLIFILAIKKTWIRKNISFGKRKCYLASIPIHKHIAAVEVSVDDTRVMQMQVIQPFQYLLGPLFQGPHGHMSVLLPVLPQIPTGADLSDEVQGVVLLIPPNTVEGNDVFVGQAS